MSGAVGGPVGGDADEDGWVPIDDALRAARGVMRSGQMVHAANFQLYHSMNALQILDAKMDVGMAPPAGEPPMKSLAALIAEGRAPLDLSDEDQTRVFDALLACEATWHRGQALATTVYTCLYMHDEERLEACRGPVMRAYFDATRSAVATVRHAVSSGDVWEEEDFVLHVAGFDVGAAAVGDDAAPDPARGLRAAETWLVENAGTEDKTRRVVGARAVPYRHARGVRGVVRLGGPETGRRRRRGRARVAASRRRAPGEGASHDGGDGGRGDETGWDPNRLGFDRKLNHSKMGPSPPRAVRLMSVQKGFAYFSDLIHGPGARADASRAGSLHDALAFLNAFRHERRKKGADPCIVSRSFAAIAVLHPSRGGVLGKHPGDAALRSAWLLGAAPPPRLRLEADPAGDLGGKSPPAGAATEPKGPTKGPTRTCLLVSWAASRPEPRSSTRRTDASVEEEEEDAAGAPGAAELRSFLAKTSLGVELLVRAHLCNRSRSRRKLRRLLGEWSALVDSAVAVDASGFVPGYLRRLGERGARGTTRPSGVGDFGRVAESPWARRAFEVWSGAVLVRAMLAHLTLGFELELYLPHELSMVYWYQEYLTEVLQGKLRVAERGSGRAPRRGGGGGGERARRREP